MCNLASLKSLEGWVSVRPIMSMLWFVKSWQTWSTLCLRLLMFKSAIHKRGACWCRRLEWGWHIVCCADVGWLALMLMWLVGLTTQLYNGVLWGEGGEKWFGLLSFCGGHWTLAEASTASRRSKEVAMFVAGWRKIHFLAYTGLYLPKHLVAENIVVRLGDCYPSDSTGRAIFLLFSDYTAVVHLDRMSNSSASSSFLNKLGNPIFVYLWRKVPTKRTDFGWLGFR